MVDRDLGAVVEQYGLAAPKCRRDVGDGGEVTHDLKIRRGVSDQGLVEPRQVLAHEPARKIVSRQNRLAARADLVLVADATISLLERPLVEAHGVGGVFILVGGCVQGELPARIVQDQIVGLCGGVDPAAELARFDDVHANRRGDVSSSIDRAF